MTICPACGSCVQGDLCLGCPSCGSRAVGPPLARAEHQLPSFGRAAFAFATGMAMLATFVGLLIATFIEKKPGPIGFWTLMTAGETVAWRVRWISIPIAIVVLVAGFQIARSIAQHPARFIGLRAARLGLSAAAMTVLLIAGLIGITVPDRLRQRQEAIEAGVRARGYTLHRALLEYQEQHGTLPTDNIEALRSLPDPDGAIADALRFVDPAGYEASAKVAAAPTKVKPLLARGAALRNVSTNSNPEPARVSFNSYKLRLPSEHRFLGSDDDFVLIDGVIKKASEVSSPSTSPRNQ